MDDTRVVRAWFTATAVAVIVGIVVQLFVTADVTEGFFDSPWKRVLNLFVFFTVQSNLMVAAACLLLASGRGSSGLGYRALRLLSTIAITLTFFVFHAVLRQLQDLTGQAAFADLLLHSVVPVLCVIGWIWFGPRGLIDRRAIALTVAYLLGWGAFTLIRGHIVGFYPYPFTDPTSAGYLRVAVNLTAIGAVFVALGFGASWVDRRLADRGLDRAAALLAPGDPPTG